MKKNNKRVRLNESTLRQMIRESLKNIIREQDELDDDPSAWGGIDDYPENETPDEQWKNDWREFYKDPHWMLSEPGADADFELRHSGLNGFQRDDQGEYGMKALNPNVIVGRDARMFNGWEHDGNPSAAKYSEEDEELPQEYLDSLNESISRAIKKVIKGK